MVRKPPHILITTPESLFILLTAESRRRYLADTRTMIVDEIHAVAGDKWGTHLALAGARLQRIGLSATQQPVAPVALGRGDAPEGGGSFRSSWPPRRWSWESTSAP